MKKMLFGVIALIFTLSLTGCTEELDTEITGSTDELVLEDGHSGSADEYGITYYINGYVKNESDKDYSYVQINFNVYDADGNTIGSCLANNSGLEANGRWKFEALCSGDANSISRYELDEITGY